MLGRALQQPGQLGVGRHVALHEQGAGLGIQAGGQQQRGHGQGGLAQLGGVAGLGQGVQVDHAVEAVALALVLDPPPHGAQEVAEVRFAGGLDAREHSGHPVMVCPGRQERPAGIVGVCPTR